MLYVNINENYGDQIEFDSLEDMKEGIQECGYDIPSDGLQEGRDYKLTYDPEEQDEFMNVFSDNMPFDYDLDRDLESPHPWATPWEWDNNFKPSDDPAEDARVYASSVYDEVSDLLDENNDRDL